MTDREIYAQWLRAYNVADARHIRGEIGPDEADSLIALIEEKLGVNTWSVARWAAAAKEEGA